MTERPVNDTKHRCALKIWSLLGQGKPYYVNIVLVFINLWIHQHIQRSVFGEMSLKVVIYNIHYENKACQQHSHHNAILNRTTKKHSIKILYAVIDWACLRIQNNALWDAIYHKSKNQGSKPTVFFYLIITNLPVEIFFPEFLHVQRFPECVL